MANILRMAKVQAIIGLLEQGWSYRRIAKELGVHRQTVARYDRLRRGGQSKSSILTAGSVGETDPKSSKVTAGSEPISSTNRSLCEPYRSIIEDKLEEGLTAQRIYQDIRDEHGFIGSYSSVKRYVRRLLRSTSLPFRRIETPPGKEVQVDFGRGAWVIDDGRKRRPYVLRVTLSNSRKSYSEAVWRQTTENFIRVLENAFRHFGGVPETVVIDNLKAAVKRADWFDPELNPKVVEFTRHYGTVIIPTKPYTPRHKGKVESGIKYLKNNALKGRVFSSLQQHNEFLLKWEGNVADTRIHGTVRKQVREMFEAEKKALRPLPTEGFPFYHEGRRKVHRDGHVEVQRAYYSVPPEYVGREVWVRWDARMVRVLNHRFEEIAVHVKVCPGRFSTNPLHIDERKVSGVERGGEYLLKRAGRIGPEAGAWARAMLQHRGVQGIRVLQGFIGLCKKYQVKAINRASEIALRGNIFRLRPLRELLKEYTEQNHAEWTQEHEIIRPVEYYSQYTEKETNR